VARKKQRKNEKSFYTIERRVRSAAPAGSFEFSFSFLHAPSNQSNSPLPFTKKKKKEERKQPIDCVASRAVFLF
jgi:hypothetical protein